LPPPAAAPAPPLKPAEEAWLLASEPVPEVTTKEAQQAIRAALQRSLVRPTAEDFRSAVVRYRYRPGRVWEITTKTDQATHLIFDLPEGWLRWRGLDVGEHGWWELDEKRTGDQGHLLITPKAPGKTGHLTVLTGLGAYYLWLKSTDTVGMTAVSWQHPPPPPPSASPSATPGTYHTGYDRLAVGPVPPWTPLAVWDKPDDGLTLILFPPERLTHEAPQLYLVTPDGKKSLVNYVMKGPWYVVHRLFEAAELRLGHDARAPRVLLKRGPRYRAIQCPGDTACPPEGWS
jgi:type IV secretion system protein TrbG